MTAHTMQDLEEYIQDEPWVFDTGQKFLKVERQGIMRLGVENPYGQPYWHVNSTHPLIGIQLGYDAATGMKIERTEDRLKMVVRGNDATPLELTGGKLDPQIDESLARLGLHVGASGGAGKCVIYIYDDDENLIPPASPIFNGDKFNIWLNTVGARRRVVQSVT